MKVEYSEDIYGLLGRIGSVRIEELVGDRPLAKIVHAQEESLLENDPVEEHLDTDHDGNQ